MQHWLIILILSLGTWNLAQAQDSSKKSSVNTKLYEEESGNSVAGRVKVIREVQEETEVFIDASKGSQGPYVLGHELKNRAALLKVLEKSEKPGGPSVTLSFDDQQHIKDVQADETKKSGK